MPIIYKSTRPDGRGTPEAISPTNPFDVQVYNKVSVASEIFKSQLITVPGIGTGAAYASGDAFGTMFQLPLPKAGTISIVTFMDYDDEGIDKELVLFDLPFTATADNSAFAVSDEDLSKCVGVININTWYNFGNNQMGVAYPALPYVALRDGLYAQIVTRGADNIAAGAIPQLFVVVS